MKLTLQIRRFHIFLSCKHLISISTDGIDLTIVYHKAVRMCSLPARIGVCTESGMHHGDRRFIIRALQICKECAELSYKKHTFIYDRTAAHRHNISIIITLFKLAACNIQHSVKRQPFFYFFRLFDKCLHDVWHTFSCFMTENLRNYRHGSPSEKFQSFFFHNDLKHLFRLCTFDLMLWEKELCNTVFSLFTDFKAFFLTGLFEEFVRNLQKDTNTITGLSFCIFTGTMLQMFYNPERIGNCIMSFFTFYIYNNTDPAVVVFKFTAVQTMIFSAYFLHIHLPFLIPDFSPAGFFSVLHNHLLPLQIHETADVHGSVWI